MRQSEMSNWQQYLILVTVRINLSSTEIRKTVGETHQWKRFKDPFLIFYVWVVCYRDILMDMLSRKLDADTIQFHWKRGLDIVREMNV